MRRLLMVPLLALVACTQDPSMPLSLPLPQHLQLSSLPEASVERLRAEVSIPGVLNKAALQIDLTQGVAHGIFTVADANIPKTAVTVDFFSGLTADSPEVVIARSIGSVQVKKGENNRVTFVETITEGSLEFDLNRNGRPNIADLLAEVDPSPGPQPLVISPRTISFESGVEVGGFTRSFFVVENVSEENVSVDLDVRLAPGVTISKLEDLFEAGTVVSTPHNSVQLIPHGQQVFSLTFAPVNSLFLAGSLSVRSFMSDSWVTHGTLTRLLGNPEGTVPQPPPGYSIPTPDETQSIGGFRGEPQVYPASHLFSLAPSLATTPEVDEGMICPDDPSSDTCDNGYDVDLGYLISVLPRHRFAVTLDTLPGDIDLYLFELDDNFTPLGEPVARSQGAGLSAEVVSYDATSIRENSTLLFLALDRINEDSQFSVPGALIQDDVDTAATLQAAMYSVPEFLTPCSEEETEPDGSPDEAEGCGIPIDSPTSCPSSYSGSLACGWAQAATQFTLRGRNFQLGAQVKVGGLTAICTNVIIAEEYDMIRCLAPPAAQDPRIAPNATVTLSNPDGQVATLVGGFTYLPPPPTIFSLSPPTGPTTGGMTTTVRGANFFISDGRLPEIIFGSTIAEAVNFISSEELAVVVPLCPACATDTTVDILAINPDGQFSVFEDFFEYQVPLAPAPIASAIEPTEGHRNGGTNVTISGVNFLPNAQVRIGETEASSVVVDPSGESITCVTPPGIPGPAHVDVINPDGQTARLANAYSYLPPDPVITGIFPSHGPQAGETTVLITGLDFEVGVQILFGDTQAVNVSLNSSSSITCVTPTMEEPGAVDVQVVNLSDNRALLPEGFTFEEPTGPPPRILGVSPSLGSTTGGDLVTITGEYFEENSSVRFQTSEALAMTYVDPSTLTALTPPHSAGTLSIQVRNSDGQADTLPAAFTYFIPPPTVSGVIPQKGPEEGGTVVLVTGQNFQSGANVLFGNTPAIGVNVNGSSTITCTTPPGASGFVDVTVINPDQQQGLGENVFSYEEAVGPPPRVFYLSPNHGPAVGGTRVEIPGENLSADADVYFDSQLAQLVDSESSDTKLVVTTPSGSAGVPVTVRVQNPDGQSDLSTYLYTAEDPPLQVISITPAVSEAYAQIPVFIVGQAFEPGISVRVELDTWSALAQDISVLQPSLISAVLPAYSGNKIDINITANLRLTNADGSTAVLENGVTYLNVSACLPDNALSCENALDTCLCSGTFCQCQNMCTNQPAGTSCGCGGQCDGYVCQNKDNDCGAGEFCIGENLCTSLNACGDAQSDCSNLSVPDNAYPICTGIGCSWACNSGFIPDDADSPTQCVVEASVNSCGPEQLNCDDGLACTTDSCAKNTNEVYVCQHVLQTNSCLIDGLCIPPGAMMPTNPCRECIPSTTQIAYSTDDTNIYNDNDVCTPNDRCENGTPVSDADICAPSCHFENAPGCPAGRTCVDTTCLLENGQSCASNEQCAETCTMTYCSPIGTTGAMCDPGDNTDCAGTLECSAGKCRFPDGEACSSGDECVNACIGNTCAPYSSLNQNCDYEQDEDCAFNHECVITTCRLSDGQTCSSNGVCANTCIANGCQPVQRAGNSCDPGDNDDCMSICTDGTCTLHQDGDDCIENEDCLNTCIASECAPIGNLDEACDLADHDDCIEGFSCGATGCTQGMLGSFNIGDGGDFETFQDAITALQNNDVALDVTFNVFPGTYNEQLVFDNITGLTSNSVVTFQSITGNADDVHLEYQASSNSNNFVVKFDSIDHIRLQNLSITAQGTSYARAVYLVNGASNIELLRNNISGYSTSSSNDNHSLVYGYNTLSSGILVIENTFTNGSSAVSLTGVGNNHSNGITITDNLINSGSSGIYLRNIDSPKIQNNTISNANFRGIDLYDCDGALDISRNKVMGTNTDYGIYLYACQGQEEQSGIIANNIVEADRGVVNLSSCSNLDVVHNTGRSLSTNTSYRTFNCESSGEGIAVFNNIFANIGGGYATYISGSSGISVLDYNTLFTPGPSLGYWDGLVAGNLLELQSFSQREQNSIEANPLFSEDGNLIPQVGVINNLGQATTLVTADFTGQPRDAIAPDMGAHEFDAGEPPLSGYYVIGATGDYTTFTAALDALTNQGVSGPTILDVQAGTYTEQLLISPIPGSSPTNTVTFRSQTGQPDDATLRFMATTTANNYVIHFAGADYIHLESLTLESLNANYGIVVSFSGGVDDVVLHNNILKTQPTGSNSTNLALIYSSGHHVRNLVITENNLAAGSHGVYFAGPSSHRLAGLRIERNTITTNYKGLTLSYLHSPQIIRNTITGPSQEGIYCYECDEQIRIERNQIASASADYGISLQYSNGSLLNGPGLIANNMIRSERSGISFNSNTYQNIYNNSVNITGSNSGWAAFYIDSYSNNTNVINNTFANSSSGYAIKVDATSALEEIHHNNLYTTGNTLALWSGAYFQTLALLESGIAGKNTNSFSENPAFASSSDLRSEHPVLDNRGAPVTEVTIDLNGNPRHNSSPDIGPIEFSSTVAPMNGTYSVGTTGDYESIGDVVADLVGRGIAGSVIVDIEPGIYTEQLIIPPIAGASESKTITFRASTGDSADATLRFQSLSSGENYVVLITGADYLRFENLGFQSLGSSYNRIMLVTGGAQSLEIRDCLFNGVSTTSSSVDRALIYAYQARTDDLVIQGNEMNFGSYAIYLDASSSFRSTDTVLSHNVISTGYGGFHLSYLDAPLVKNNTLSGMTNRGIYLYDCDGATTVTSNKLLSSNTQEGIYLNSCDGSVIAGSSTVSNNFIQASRYGIHLEYSTYQDIYNNSVRLSGTNTGYRCFYLSQGGQTNVVNNIFANAGGGYATEIRTPSAILSSDYNLLFTTGASIGYWNSSAYEDLGSFQQASGHEANSISIDPGFVSNSDLHATAPLLDNRGTPVPSVSTDIDNEARDSEVPDMGADEFTASGIPMAGTYAVGPSGAYASLAEAITALQELGAIGAVTLSLETGTYLEQITIPPISGTSDTTRITVESASGNAEDVTIQYQASGSSDNFVIQLNGADHFTFRNLSITGLNGTYPRVVYLSGGINDIEFENVTFSGQETTSSSSERALIYGYSVPAKDLKFSNCTFALGSFGIWLEAPNSNRMSGIVIEDSVFSNYYTGLHLMYFDAPTITNNTLTNMIHAGIDVSYSNGAGIVQNNQISGNGLDYGIYLYSMVSSVVQSPGIIANNFVQVEKYGIHIDASHYFDVLYNSVLVTGGATNNYAFYCGGTAEINVINNIFANSGGGYASKVNSVNAISTSDFNAYYTPGAYLAEWGGTKLENVEALQTYDGKDINSIELNPAFVSTTNLHVLSVLLNNLGTPITSLVEDIDGNARDDTTPDIGADEFTTDETPLAGTYTIGATGEFSSLGVAIEALEVRGVSDAVVLQLQSGTYVGQVLIETIPGTSSTKSLTIESESGNPADVTMHFSATQSSNNYILFLRGADHIRIRNLTLTALGNDYARVILLSGGMKDVLIENTLIQMQVTTNSSDNRAGIYGTLSALDDFQVTGSTISNGAYGIRLFAESSNRGTNIVLTNNTISTHQTGMYLSYLESMEVSGNEISAVNGQGIYLYDSDGAHQIKGNSILSAATDYGIRLEYCNGSVLGGNALIANNFIRAERYGISTYGTSYLDIVHNTVATTGSNSNYATFYLGGSNSNLRTVNNIFVNDGGGYTFYIESAGAIIQHDYNAYYAPGNWLGKWGSSNIRDLNELQSVGQIDLNSLTINPAFVSSTDLHTETPLLDNLGVAWEGINEDIDGNARSASNPDIGAAEFTATLTPLNGTYSVGEGQNYESVSSAVADLHLLGISGPTTFQIVDGTYTDRFTLLPVSGASTVNRIRFESLSGNASNVIIQNLATNPDSNYIANLFGASWINFTNLSFKALGSSHGTLVVLSGGIHDLTFDGSTFEGASTTSTSSNLSLFKASSANLNNISVTNNDFTGGARGITWSGTSPHGLGIAVSDNTFSTYADSIVLSGFDAVNVSNNTILGQDYSGIYLYDCDGEITVTKNNINSTTADYGIRLEYCNGSVLEGSGQISNNLIRSERNAIYLYQSSYQDIHHNSGSTNGSSTTYRTCSLETCNNLDMSNNICAEFGSGYAIYQNSGSNFTLSNNMYWVADISRVAYWGGTYVDSSLIGSFDTNSVFQDPGYVSTTDLHLQAGNNAGASASGVDDDIDGEVRDVNTPDIGADEVP